MRYLLTAMTAVLFTAAASAQTGPALMIRPWVQTDAFRPAVEAAQEAIVMPDAEGERGYDAAVSIYETIARWRLEPQAEHSVSVGFEQSIIDGGSNAVIDLRNRVNQSLAIGVPLAWTDDGWEFALTAGFGYAGNNAYGDGDAWYGLGSFIATKRLDASSSLQLLLVYDGNRGLWPDTPLPAVAYNHQVNEQLAYTVGLPYSSLLWRPVDRLTLRASYVLPTSVTAGATYELFDWLDAFASFDRRLYVFHDNALSDHRRVFFEQQRIESGLRWKPCDYAEAIVAAGLAFEQEYQTGYDVRDLHDSAGLDDEIYMRFGVNLKF